MPGDTANAIPIEVWPEGIEEYGLLRYISQDERDKMPDSDFGWPEQQQYPIPDQKHLDAAVKLIGRAPADKQSSIKRHIITIAKRKGLSLPDTWKDGEDDNEKGDTSDRMQASEHSHVDRAVDGSHEPFTGTHSHAHPAFGSQGDDDTHSHDHEHNGDANHDHSHDDGSQDRAHTQQHRAIGADSAIQASDRHVMSLPLVRIDAAKREVWGQATAEIPDSYGTIFGYYPKAWEMWRGNIREQHDPKKAVGKRVDLDCNEQERAIYVGSRISRGAQDTWLKVEDDVLSGYSASIIPDPEYGNDPRKWPKKLYNGKEYPYLPRYTVAELSLVDNPACPGCNIQIVRADGFATDVLDLTEEEPVTQKPATQERAGARVGAATKSKMHDSIGHTLQAASSQMQNCGCDDCCAALKLIDPDGDGDVDLGGYADPDNDWQALYNNNPTQDMERVVTELIERSLQPVYSRLQSIAGTLARSNGSATPMNIDSLITSSFTRAFEALDAKFAALPTQSSLDEVRTELSVVKGQVERIAEQPMPGGPVLNANAMPRPPIEKQLATDPPLMQQPRQSYGSVYDAIASMSRSGQLDTENKQVDAMTAALIAQRRR